MPRALLNVLAAVSIVMVGIGFMAAFLDGPMKMIGGSLFPLGLAIFWVVGAIARRQ